VAAADESDRGLIQILGRLADLVIDRLMLEVGSKDAFGTPRWRTVDGGIMAVRLLARRDRGEMVAPDSRLRFGEAADLRLSGRL
jgi:hypothetical protein